MIIAGKDDQRTILKQSQQRAIGWRNARSISSRRLADPASWAEPGATGWLQTGCSG